MNALSLSATRRRDQVVILTRLRYGATPRPSAAALACAIRERLTAEAVIIALGALCALTTLWTSIHFVLSGADTPSVLLPVSAVLALVLALADAAQISDKQLEKIEAGILRLGSELAALRLV